MDDRVETVREALEEHIDMDTLTMTCRNCVTPWKCNGPHLDALGALDSLAEELGSLRLELLASEHAHQSDNEYLTAENTRLREALRYYADEESWNDTIMDDAGDRALAALSSQEEDQ